jgi:hypothetical protein
VLRNDLGMLGYLLHAPRGLFIAPRQLGAVGGNLGRQFLPSVGWRTGQSGADRLSKMAQPTIVEL